ncbi:uncharacterized protein TRIADDRAFT_31001, partial [Trichoplax adhaerens]
ETCITSDGDYYRGRVRVTETGKNCISWSKAPPPFTSSNYQEYDLWTNWCRNPGASRAKPWCYISDTTFEWEYCNITTCGPTNITSGSLYPLGGEGI